MKKLILYITLLLTLQAKAQVQPSLIINGHKDGVNTVAFSPDSRWLFSGGKDGEIRQWKADSLFAFMKSTVISDASVSALEVSHDGNKLAAGTYRRLYIYNTADLKKINRVKKAHVTFVESIAWSGDDKTLATSSWKENSLKLWDATSLKKKFIFAESAWTDDIGFTSDNKVLLSANHSSTVKAWDIGTGNIVKTFAGHEDWIYAMVVTSDSKKLITGAFDNTIKVWDIASGRLLQTLGGHTEGVYQLALLNDTFLFSYGMDLKVRIWDLNKAAQVSEFSCPAKALSITVSPDGKYLACGLEDKTIALWTIADLLIQN